MKSRRIVLFTAFAVALVASSFWLGFREGAHVSLLIDSAPRGALSLDQLERGTTRNTAISLETDIDVALLWSDRLEQSALYPLLEPLWGLPVSSNAEYLHRLATYRRAHPSPLRAEALATGSAGGPAEARALAETLAGAQKNERIIARVVKKYSTVSAAP